MNHFFEDEYQDMIHRCGNELRRTDISEEYRLVISGLLKYAEGNEEWEKSYHYGTIIQILQEGIQYFDQALPHFSAEELLLVKTFRVMSEIIIKAIEVENGLIGNNSGHMAKFAREAAELAFQMVKEYPANVPEDSILYAMQETLMEYYHYQAGFAEYSELITLKRTDPNKFGEVYEQKSSLLMEHTEILMEIGTDITKTEVNAFLQNLQHQKRIWDEKKPQISISSSSHYLSISFYTGADFANFLIQNMGDKSGQWLSTELFDSTIEIESGGIDKLDDFLQTAIGTEYADNLHYLIGGGTIDHLGGIEFRIDLLIRRFGVATVLFTIDLENKVLNVSDLRTLQQLVGPQAGTNHIQWQTREYSRLEEICREIEIKLLKYHNTKWLEASSTLEDFLMDRVPYEHERTWYTRSLLRSIELLEFDGSTKEIFDFRDLTQSPDFKGLVIPLYEGRSALDDWLQKPEKNWKNLADIRSHSVDLIVQTRHTLTIFMPDDPEWIVSQIQQCGTLVNDIVTLVISFDIMAEKVRSSLISQVQDAKYALEDVKMNKMTDTIDQIRKRSIELTEFELLALQSIQLLRNQGTLKFFDHSEFMQNLIETTNIEPTIDSLQKKLTMVKESQRGIVRTSDDILAAYKERVSASQQQIIKVVTLLIAGFAQISIVDAVLNVFVENHLLNETMQGPIKATLIILVVIISIIALFWLVWGYFKSRRTGIGEKKKKKKKRAQKKVIEK